MNPLNLPPYQATIRNADRQRPEIFDPVRKKYVALTPEEWVRQHMLNYLICEKQYTASLLGVEVTVTYNRMKKRGDIVAYDRTGKPILIVECKAPDVKITQNVFDQIAMYNCSFAGKFLVVTNGMEHYACSIDHEQKTWKFLPDIPGFNEICL